MSESKPLYTFEMNLIEKLSKLNMKQKNDIKNNIKKAKKKYFKSWYMNNIDDLNYYFKHFTRSIEFHDIECTICKKNLYNKFIEFSFKQSSINE